MMNFIYGMLVAWFLLSFIEGETTICGVLEFPMDVCFAIIQIVILPFMCFYGIFLRHTIKPVSLEQVEKAKIMEDSKHLFGSIYVCFDKKAKRLMNKVFLFRIEKKGIDKTDKV